MHCSAQYWLVDIDIAISYLYVKAAFRIGTNPDLIVDGCPLASKIGQRHQIASIAFLAFGENNVLH